GKTSTARILAKMVNCENGPTPEPCGVCEQCLRIREGTHLDVVEIDAASHGGVEDARDLREKAPTAPAQGREKVYIIDEAQRLSREAFDALLKVFEEPPVGVRFVLATTEPHKMPATIVGRCQRFAFRRVPVEAVAEHLERIAKDEGMSLTAEAAHSIARQTEGSVRDALSLLDQASVLGAGEIGEDMALSVIGRGRLDGQCGPGDAVWGWRSGTPRACSSSSAGSCRRGRISGTSPTRCSRTSATCCSSRPRPASTICSTPPTRRPSACARRA